MPGLEDQDKGDGKFNRNEKKCRKALMKVGMKQMGGITRITLKKRDGLIFVIDDPEVLNLDNSYAIFGELKLEDLNRQMQMEQAKKFAAQAQPAAAGATGAAAAKTEAEDDGAPLSEEGLTQNHIKMVMDHTSCTRNAAIKALRETNDDMDKDGLFLATASNDEHGYIVRGYLAAGDEPEVIYTTSYTDIFGILYNAQTDMMYWIEERGFANGIYVRKMDMKYGCDDDNECAEQFLQLLEKAYWVAAIWDIKMMFACDYANSKVFAFTMNNDGSFGDEVSLVSPEANPRCIGYYYGYDIDTPGAFDFGGQTKRAP